MFVNNEEMQGNYILDECLQEFNKIEYYLS